MERDTDQSTCSPAASLVSHTLVPGSEEARMMTVRSGRRCIALSEKPGPVGSLAKMLLASSIWDSTRVLLTWKWKVTRPTVCYSSLRRQRPAQTGQGMDYCSKLQTRTRERNASPGRSGGQAELCAGDGVGVCDESLVANAKDGMERETKRGPKGRIITTGDNQIASDTQTAELDGGRRTRDGRDGSTNPDLHASDTEIPNERWQEGWLEAATRLCRVDDGLPGRVDRLKSLGNSIVPQVAAATMQGIKAVMCVMLMFILGCATREIKQRADLSLAAAQSIARSLPAQEFPIPKIVTQLVGWGDKKELENLTLEEIRFRKIVCIRMIKDEYRPAGLRWYFEYHKKGTGKDYLYTIVENWMKEFPRAVQRGNSLMVPSCESCWEHGDLNADGRVNYEDFAIYAGVPP